MKSTSWRLLPNISIRRHILKRSGGNPLAKGVSAGYEDVERGFVSGRRKIEMSFSPPSLQRRFTILLIIPVTLLLVIMGVAGFFYARDQLLDEWREAAILKLQRAAREVDMRLDRIKETIRLLNESSGAPNADSVQAWVLDRLTRQEGIADVKLSWNAPEKGTDMGMRMGMESGRAPDDSQAMGRGWRMHRFHRASIRDITPPRFDARGEHGTVSLISQLLDEDNQVVGRLVVVANFDALFRHVMESGWWQSNKAFLVDTQGQILVSTLPARGGSLQESTDPLERETARLLGSDRSGTLRGEGHPPTEVSGFFRLQEAPWVLVMIAPGKEILAPIIQFRLYYSLIVVGFIVLVIGLIRQVTMRTASQIREVSQAALRLSHGEFGAPLPMRSRDEVGELTHSFNVMIRQLKDRLRLKEAMGLAMEVQQNLLPASPPRVPGLDIAGRSLYCQETGGDYFDYIPLGGPAGPRLCVAVGDVVGHGISAALLMTTVRALLRCRLDAPGSTAEVMGDVNRLLSRDTAASGSFVTLFLLLVDPAAGNLDWVRAGHDPALLYCAATEEVQNLGGPGMALGVDGRCSYRNGSRAGLAAGDIILIGTDGVWETQNSTSENFGKIRIGEMLKRHRHRDAEGILRAILEALDAFRGGTLQQDDVTLMVIKATETGRG
ncbi:MAG: SpoIIE family protein phosphatase [Hyphomicrobiales bacterium]